MAKTATEIGISWIDRNFGTRSTAQFGIYFGKATAINTTTVHTLFYKVLQYRGMGQLGGFVQKHFTDEQTRALLIKYGERSEIEAYDNLNKPTAPTRSRGGRRLKRKKASVQSITAGVFARLKRKGAVQAITDIMLEAPPMAFMACNHVPDLSSVEDNGIRLTIGCAKDCGLRATLHVIWPDENNDDDDLEEEEEDDDDLEEEEEEEEW